MNRIVPDEIRKDFQYMLDLRLAIEWIADRNGLIRFHTPANVVEGTLVDVLIPVDQNLAATETALDLVDAVNALKRREDPRLSDAQKTRARVMYRDGETPCSLRLDDLSPEALAGCLDHVREVLRVAGVSNEE